MNAAPEVAKKVTAAATSDGCPRRGKALASKLVAHRRAGTRRQLALAVYLDGARNHRVDDDAVAAESSKASARVRPCSLALAAA